jgi:hypothetical protein
LIDEAINRRVDAAAPRVTMQSCAPAAVSLLALLP